MSAVFRIQFDGDFFLSGQQVSGVVYLHLAERMKARKAKIEVKGHAQTRWTESEPVHTLVLFEFENSFSGAMLTVSM